MKAAVNERYGSPDSINIREIPTPKPKTGDRRDFGQLLERISMKSSCVKSAFCCCVIISQRAF